MYKQKEVRERMTEEQAIYESELFELKNALKSYLEMSFNLEESRNKIDKLNEVFDPLKWKNPNICNLIFSFCSLERSWSLSEGTPDFIKENNSISIAKHLLDSEELGFYKLNKEIEEFLTINVKGIKNDKQWFSNNIRFITHKTGVILSSKLTANFKDVEFDLGKETAEALKELLIASGEKVTQFESLLLNEKDLEGIEIKDTGFLFQEHSFSSKRKNGKVYSKYIQLKKDDFLLSQYKLSDFLS